MTDIARGKTKKTQTKKAQYYDTPFREYFKMLSEIDKGQRDSKEFGSMLILGLVEEIGEMARAYLTEHGRKGSNLRAQIDESVEQELGDILVSILRMARIKKINLHERLLYSLNKVRDRKARIAAEKAAAK